MMLIPFENLSWLYLKLSHILTIQCVTITHAFVVGVKPRLNIVDILKPAEDMIEVQTTQEPIAGTSNQTGYYVVATYICTLG